MTQLAPSLTDLYAPVGDDLAATAELIDNELASELPLVNALCASVRSYGGKMLRPALLMLSGRATGELSGAHRTLAAVIEMVHMATLVHDDVLDGADERRGRPTVRAVNGNVAAVLLGDYFISHAFHLCSSLCDQGASRRVGAATNTVCEGELLQNHRSGDPELSEAEYFSIVERKTGALTAVACELGASFAGADASRVASMTAYGMFAGVAFQIIDDVLDIVGERGEVGKTLGLDLDLGKPTLAVIHCLAHAKPASRSALRSVVIGTARCEPERLIRWLNETQSIDYATSVAAEYVGRAVQRLDAVPPSNARASLVAMAEFILERRS